MLAGLSPFLIESEVRYPLIACFVTEEVVGELERVR